MLRNNNHPVSETLIRLVDDVQSRRLLNIDDYTDDSCVQHFLQYLTGGYYDFEGLLNRVANTPNPIFAHGLPTIALVTMCFLTYTGTVFELALRMEAESGGMSNPIIEDDSERNFITRPLAEIAIILGLNTDEVYSCYVAVMEFVKKLKTQLKNEGE